ncbi:MAG: DUF4167 domain-containing protein [Holosporales bacterium]|jgi:hypothetical protein|nr:DUF4167 domain-containing protein [Holosporales bacterium]
MKRESSKPKSRVYYQNIKAKYVAAAHDASSAGDRISYEYNLQIAEHYSRIISEKFKTVKKRGQKSAHSEESGSC